MQVYVPMPNFWDKKNFLGAPRTAAVRHVEF